LAKEEERRKGEWEAADSLRVAPSLARCLEVEREVYAMVAVDWDERGER
jgi:hypothetical protein